MLFRPPPVAAPKRTSRDLPLVRVKGLSYRYPEAVEWALKDVSLTIPRGSFLAIAGQNGSGKTTLLNHITGLIRPPARAVWVDGEDVAQRSPAAVARKLAYVFQNPEHQFIANTVREELAVGLRSRGMTSDQVEGECDRILIQFELDDVAGTNPHAISGGQMRRLSVAAMLVLDPVGFLLDEPTFGQDRRTAGAIMSLLRSLNEAGKTIAMVTHDMRLVAEYADTVAVMANGRLVWFGEPRNLFGRDDILKEACLLAPPSWEMSKLLGCTAKEGGALSAKELVSWIEAAATTVR